MFLKMLFLFIALVSPEPFDPEHGDSSRSADEGTWEYHNNIVDPAGQDDDIPEMVYSRRQHPASSLSEAHSGSDSESDGDALDEFNSSLFGKSTIESYPSTRNKFWVRILWHRDLSHIPHTVCVVSDFSCWGMILFCSV